MVDTARISISFDLKSLSFLDNMILWDQTVQSQFISVGDKISHEILLKVTNFAFTIIGRYCDTHGLNQYLF